MGRLETLADSSSTGTLYCLIFQLSTSSLVSSSIMSPTPQVIIMGYSVVHHFHPFLVLGSERRVRLNLSRSAHVNYYGVSR